MNITPWSNDWNPLLANVGLYWNYQTQRSINLVQDLPRPPLPYLLRRINDDSQVFDHKNKIAEEIPGIVKFGWRSLKLKEQIKVEKSRIYNFARNIGLNKSFWNFLTSYYKEFIHFCVILFPWRQVLHCFILMTETKIIKFTLYISFNLDKQEIATQIKIRYGELS